MAVVRQAVHSCTASAHCLPSPVAIHLHVLPHHACTRVHGRRAGALTSPALLRAAPVLLLRRPSAEEVVQRGQAVEGVGCHALHSAPGFLDGAGPAHVALHLNLAVGQVASIGLSGEGVLGRPLDEVHALGGLAVDSASSITLQWRQRCVRAALLKVLTAPLLLCSAPSLSLPSAVELDAALVGLVAAPVLLGIRPPLHPVGEASFAVVNSAMRMANSVRDVHIGVKVEAAFPCSWAAHALVTTAP